MASENLSAHKVGLSTTVPAPSLYVALSAAKLSRKRGAPRAAFWLGLRPLRGGRPVGCTKMHILETGVVGRRLLSTVHLMYYSPVLPHDLAIMLPMVAAVPTFVSRREAWRARVPTPDIRRPTQISPNRAGTPLLRARLLRTGQHWHVGARSWALRHVSLSLRKLPSRSASRPSRRPR